MNLKEIETSLNRAGIELEDEKTEKYNWKKPSKVKRLEKKAGKLPDHVLVQYLTQTYQIRRLLCRVVGGNIVVIHNKVHILNPRFVYRDGKTVWYIIREIDRLPVSNIDYDKLMDGRTTINDSVVIKAILGAVQKKEIAQSTKKALIWIISIAVIAFLVYIFFFAK